MAIKLEPGELTIHLQYGKDLKDADWFGEQDPYVILKCGKDKIKSNTHHGGGRNPVWNHQFVFKVDQETKVELEVRDEDLIKDDWIGKGEVEIVSVRFAPAKRHDVQVPLFRRLSHRQQGYVSLGLTFLPATPAAAASSGSARSNNAPLADVHEREAAAAAAAAAAFATENAEMCRGAPDTSASPHLPAPGSSLPAGLASPGSLPDTVPSYVPTCGLIEPQPHKLLPCHQGRVSGSNMATQAAPPASPTPAPCGTAPPMASAPSLSYPAVHAQSFHHSGSVASGQLPQSPVDNAQPYTQPYQAPPPLQQAYYQHPPPLQPSYSQHAPPLPQTYPQHPPPLAPSYSNDPYGTHPAGYGTLPPVPAGHSPPPAAPPYYGATAPYGVSPQPYSAPPMPPPAYGMPPPPPPAGYYAPAGYASHM